MTLHPQAPMLLLRSYPSPNNCEREATQGRAKIGRSTKEAWEEVMKEKHAQ